MLKIIVVQYTYMIIEFLSFYLYSSVLLKRDEYHHFI